MIGFFTENLSTILISIGLAVIVILIIAKMIRDKKAGKCCGCSEGCSGCGASSEPCKSKKNFK